MKIAKTIFAALFLVSNIAASSMAPADDGVIEKAVAPGSYCHQKFRAIDPSTLDATTKPKTSPVHRSMPANKESVPWRMYS